MKNFDELYLNYKIPVDRNRPEYEAITKEIPDGMEPIGIKCSTSSCDREIPRIALIMWKPRNYWQQFEAKKPSPPQQQETETKCVSPL